MILKRWAWWLGWLCFVGNFSFAQNPVEIYNTVKISPTRTATPALQVTPEGTTILKALRLDWDENFNYKRGDMVLRSDGHFYKAQVDITASDWNASQWAFIGGGSGIFTYSETAQYYPGTLAIYSFLPGYVSICKANDIIFAPAGPFNSASWTVIGNFIPSTLTINGSLVISNTVFNPNQAQKLLLSNSEHILSPARYTSELINGVVVSGTLSVTETSLLKSMQLSYNQKNTYQKGDLVLYSNGKFYVAQNNIPAGTSWSNTLWTPIGQGIPIFTSTLSYSKGDIVLYNPSPSEVGFFQAKANCPAGIFSTSLWGDVAPSNFPNAIWVQKTTTVQSLLVTGNSQLTSDTLIKGTLTLEKNMIVSGITTLNNNVSMDNMLQFTNSPSSQFALPYFPKSYFSSTKPTVVGQIAYNVSDTTLMLAYNTKGWTPLSFSEQIYLMDLTGTNYIGEGIVGMLDLKDVTLQTYNSSGQNPGYYHLSLPLQSNFHRAYSIQPSLVQTPAIVNVSLYAADGSSVLYSSEETFAKPIYSKDSPAQILAMDDAVILDPYDMGCYITTNNATSKLVYPNLTNTISLPSSTGGLVNISDVAVNRDYSSTNILPSFLSTLPTTAPSNLTIGSTAQVSLTLVQAQNLFYAHKAIITDGMNINKFSYSPSFKGIALQYGGQSGLSTLCSKDSPIIWLGYSTILNTNFADIGCTSEAFGQSCLSQLFVLSLPESHPYSQLDLTTANGDLFQNLVVYALAEEISPANWIMIGNNITAGNLQSGTMNLSLLPINTSTLIFYAYGGEGSPVMPKISLSY